jgi:hypothetical protein
MERKNQMHYTPSKRLGAKRIVCDDDSQILKLASAKGAVIVSNDNFKRFLNHNVEFKLVVEERVLMYSFIDGEFMPADDPLGKNGPSLDNFLRFHTFQNQQYMKRCPYKKKCTYGAKCKFWHPERVASGPTAATPFTNSAYAANANSINNNGGYKSVHQKVQDEASEQKMRLEIILNNAQDGTLSRFVGAQYPPKPISPPKQQATRFADEIGKTAAGSNPFKTMGPNPGR